MSNEEFPVQTYVEARCAVMHKTTAQYGHLLNVARGFPLRFGKITVRSNEALYQACRFPHRPDLQAKIIEQQSPLGASVVAAEVITERRKDWDEVRVPIMEWVIRVKLMQHFVRFGELLLSTEDKPIVEWSRTNLFWGATPIGPGVLRGQNVRGVLLTRLRDDLLYHPERLEELAPPPVGLCLMGEPIPTILPEGG